MGYVPSPYRPITIANGGAPAVLHASPTAPPAPAAPYPAGVAHMFVVAADDGLLGYQQGGSASNLPPELAEVVASWGRMD